ncbi:MAG TPA: DoxX family protein [Gemmatimonadaceae bacterium]|nr:DoxX family protein [Gemmatimonadaceae bacterium]
MRSPDNSTSGNVPLWIIQVLVALVFLATGGMKLVFSSAALAAQSPVPLPILRILGVCEVLGALGLVLPGLFKVRRGLTPIAAAGLFTVASGATGATLAMGQSAMAILPAVLGVLAAIIAAGRRAWLAAEVEPSSVQNAPPRDEVRHAHVA